MITAINCFLAVNKQGGEGLITENETFSGIADDEIIWGEDANYTTARNKAVGDYSFEGDIYIGAGQELWYGTYCIARGFLYFDTSALPEDITITKVILKLYNHEKSIDKDFDIVIQNGMPDYPSIPNVLSDFDRTKYNGNGGSINTSDWTEYAYNEIELNETGISWINKSGITKFAIRSGDDISATPPTGSEVIYFCSQENTNENKRPVLYIEYGVIGEKLKTYTKIDCDLHVNANDDNFFGRLIRCDLEVKRDLVNACLGIVTPAEGQPGGGIQQSIRLKITVDGEDVSAALVGQVMIQHNENLISTFSFNLGDFQYSPLFAGDYEDKEVVITAYVNGKEVKLFTGLVDGTRSDKSDKYNLNVYGSCYGKKLLKRMTLISVQEAATKKTRGAIIRYLAGQAGITNMDVPTGSKTEIDHSFQDQFIWDMIQKEMMIEGWVIRFDENGKMLVYKKVIKTDETRYPTPDWEYGEDKFILLGLNTTREGIINQITILGAIFEEEVFTVEKEEWTCSIDVPDEEYDEDSGDISKDFDAGESVTAWSYNDGNFRVFAKYLGSSKSPYVTYTQYQDYQFTVENLIGNHLIKNVEVSVSGGAVIYSQGSTWFKVHRLITDPIEWDFTEMAFSISITVYYKELTGGGAVWITENLPNENVVSTITHTQIKAIVSDPASIAKYKGERKPNEEGTEEYPLAETEAQCIDIGQRRIRDSHRYTKQPDFQVNLNPKMLVGECVYLTDRKIGYNGRWYLEEVVHYFDIDPETGAIKPRTRIGCVFYA